jgi:hypothetical protein
VAAGDVAEPVADREQTPETADVAGRKRKPGISPSQVRLGEIEHEVVRPHRDDRSVDLLEAAQQRDVDVLSGVQPLRAGGDDHQRIRPDERREDSGAA